MTEKSSSSGEKLLCHPFCGKHQNEVKKLIAGSSVIISDERSNPFSDTIDKFIEITSATQSRSTWQGDAIH
jgi:ATP-dependent protease Clp ATPase subunit